MKLQFNNETRVILAVSLAIIAVCCSKKAASTDFPSNLVEIHHSRSTGCFYGFVVDHHGIPVEGALVLLESSEAKLQLSTDKIGRFIFNDLKPGSYQATVRKDGFAAVRLSPKVEIDPDARRQQMFTLDPEISIESVSK